MDNSHEDHYAFMDISLLNILRMRNVLDKYFKEIWNPVKFFG